MHGKKTNIRYVTPDKIDDLVDFVSIDVSFISLRKVLEPVSKLMNVDAEIVCLIKPQFEAGREKKVGKKKVLLEIEPFTKKSFKGLCTTFNLYHSI